MERLAAQQRPFLLVADVGLPSEAGTSFRAGSTSRATPTGLASPPPVLLISETIDEKLRSHAKRAGAALLAFKPGPFEARPAAVRGGPARVRRQAGAGPAAPARGPPSAGRPAPLRLAPLRLAPLRLAPQPVVLRPRDDAARSARRLWLRASRSSAGHPDPDMVAFLLLRAARAFFPRVVLFLVRDERLRGLAGFGPVANGASLDLLARELSVPLGPASPFAEAVAFGRAWSGPLAGGTARSARWSTAWAASAPCPRPCCRCARSTRRSRSCTGTRPAAARCPSWLRSSPSRKQAGRALDSALLERRAPTELAC